MNCIKCNKKFKNRKFRNPKTSCIFNKTLLLSIICSRCGSNNYKLFEEEESIETLKIFGLINN